MNTKIRLLAGALSISMLLLTGCVSDEKHEQALEQIENLTNECSSKDIEITEMSKKQQELEDQVLSLEKKLDEVENGASSLLVKIRNHYENKEYEKAIEVATTLHEKFNGKSEDIEGQGIADQCRVELDTIEATKKAEAERLEQEKLKNAQDKVRELIRVKSISYDMDSAGGVDVYIKWVNNSDKEIKYATFKVSPYNAVGDEVLNHGKYDATNNLKDTGPFKKGEGSSGNTYWSNCWYNSTTNSIQLEGIVIEYMDGTSVTLTGNDVKYAQY